jgi:hypothetical protein
MLSQTISGITKTSITRDVGANDTRLHSEQNSLYQPVNPTLESVRPPRE